MERWDDRVQEDHRALGTQAGALEAALTADVNPHDRRVVLSWIVRTLWSALELHLRKEKEALFPAVQHVLGREAAALTILNRQHEEFRVAYRRLAELLQGYEDLNWEGIGIAIQNFIDRLEDHEKKTERLLLDVLEFNLKPKELLALSQTFEQVAQKAHEEEGWPTDWWVRRNTITQQGKPVSGGHLPVHKPRDKKLSHV